MRRSPDGFKNDLSEDARRLSKPVVSQTTLSHGLVLKRAASPVQHQVRGWHERLADAVIGPTEPVTLRMSEAPPQVARLSSRSSYGSHVPGRGLKSC